MPPLIAFFYVSPGTKCIAKPSKGFEFSSWGEILDDNSTRTINASTTSGSPLSAFLDMFNFKSSDPASILTAKEGEGEIELISRIKENSDPYRTDKSLEIESSFRFSIKEDESHYGNHNKTVQ
jgi:hypothetical protein